MDSSAPRSTRGWRTTLRNPMVMVGLAYIAVLALVAIFAPALASHDPMEIDVTNRLQGPSAEHWFGTDEVGRDQYSRVVYGTRIALRASFQSVLVALAFGVPAGLAIGYFGGIVDRVSMRFVDVIGAIPLLLFAIAIVAALGRGLGNALIAVSIAFSISFIRLTRGQVLAERERLYVDAARVLGLRRLRILFKEILPNVSGPLVVQSSIYLGVALLIEAMLSFLGLGVEVGEPSWGKMLDIARQWQSQQPWMAVFPGLAITISVLMYNVLGDGLRETLGLAPRRMRTSVRPVSAGRTLTTSTAGTEETGDALLSVTDLRVRFPADRGEGRLEVVRGVDFSVHRGEIAGLVGESGSGKSLSALSVAGLVPAPGQIDGSIRLRGRELVGLGEEALNRIRGNEVGFIFQDPMSALSSVHTVGQQITEPIRHHLGLSKRAARERAIDLLNRVGVPAPASRLDDYPFQFSGGMAQRVMMAIALAAEPELLIADEPATALDVTIQEQVLDLLLDIRSETGMAILLITHDLGVVADTCDKVSVMYAGKIVESRPVDDLFSDPRHPYTAALLSAMPRNEQRGGRLDTIPGRVPPPWEWPDGCAFAPRCRFAEDRCTHDPIPWIEGALCVRAEEIELTNGIPT